MYAIMPCMCCLFCLDLSKTQQLTTWADSAFFHLLIQKSSMAYSTISFIYLSTASNYYFLHLVPSGHHTILFLYTLYFFPISLSLYLFSDTLFIIEKVFLIFKQSRGTRLLDWAIYSNENLAQKHRRFAEEG